MSDNYFTPYFTGNSTKFEPSRFIDNYGTLPIKCPYCGHRQDIWKDGANCKTCGGDVLNDRVK